MPPGKKDLSINEALLNAMNSQGFLLQDLVLNEAKKGFEDREHRLRWVLEAREYPVRAADDSETKIDLVLSHKNYRGIFTTLECKRAHPDYKAWVFFGNHGVGQLSGDYTFTEGLIKKSPSVWTHKIHHAFNPIEIPIFSYYLEARIDTDKKPAGTDTIENAFTQVIRGQSGLVSLVLKQPPSDTLLFLPLVVTTADLYKLEYEVTKIALRDGTLEAPSAVEPLQWCAVTYHTSTKLKITSDHVEGDASGTNDRLDRDVRSLYARTIYVVQAVHLRKFLLKLGQSPDNFFQ